MNESSKKNVIILGAGGHAHVAAEILGTGHENRSRYSLLGFLDGNKDRIGDKIARKPVLGAFDILPEISHDLIFIAIGDNITRKRIFEYWRKRGERFVNLIHPSAIISSDVVLGSGVMVGPGVIINPGSIIGSNVILNTGSTVDHHNRIGDHAHIAPGVHLAGDVSIGNGCLMGIGSVVIPQQSVGAWSIVAAGSVITQTVREGTLVAGVPARERVKDPVEDNK